MVERIKINMSYQEVGNPCGELDSFEFIMGFFYIFIYKDFFIREVLIAYRFHKDGQDDANLQAMEQSYSKFFYEQWTIWVFNLIDTRFNDMNNLFINYDATVLEEVPKWIITALDPAFKNRRDDSSLEMNLWTHWSYQQLFRRFLAILMGEVPQYSQFLKSNPKLKALFS